MLKMQPKLSEIYDLIEKVPKYPIKAKQLVDFAADHNASNSLINFYGAFTPELNFHNKKQLKDISEEVQIMDKEKNEQPRDEYAQED
jgi:uncharacterized protein YbgA (DUF1722 family)